MSLFTNSTMTSTVASRTTYSTARVALSATETFIHEPTPDLTPPRRYDGQRFDVYNQVVDIPFDCDAIHGFNYHNYTGWPWGDTGFVELSANPDIAGLGVSDVLGMFTAKL